MNEKSNKEVFSELSENQMKEISVPSPLIITEIHDAKCGVIRSCADGRTISCSTDVTGQKCIVNEDEDVEGNKIVSIQCGTMKFSCIAPNDSEGGSGSGSGGEKPTEPTDPTDPVEPVPSGSETDKTPETGNGALL